MVSKSFLEFIDNYEKDLDDFIRTESQEQEEQPIIQEKVVPKVVPQPVVKKVVKESSTPFSFCTSCGQKSPYVKGGKFCTFCGSQSLNNTAQKSSVNNVTEDVDYASSLLDETPMESSRLLQYMSKQKQLNPLNQLMGQNDNDTIPVMRDMAISETASHACDLLDETPEMSVKLLEMPDFSKFMSPQSKQENIQTPMVEMQPNVQVGDDDVQRQMRDLGLL